MCIRDRCCSILLTTVAGISSMMSTASSTYKMCIRDSAKVTRSALQNASSVAALVLTTESLVADIPDPKADAAAAAAMAAQGVGMY